MTRVSGLGVSFEYRESELTKMGSDSRTKYPELEA